MATRFIGNATIRITYHDEGDYRGTVSADGHVHHFSGLHDPPSAVLTFGADSPEAYDRMASAAVSFAVASAEEPTFTPCRGCDRLSVLGSDHACIEVIAAKREVAYAIEDAAAAGLTPEGDGYYVRRKREAV